MVRSGWIHALVYGAMRLVLTPAVRFYFRRLEPVDLDLLPRRGPVLVVANHPSSLTDVLVLGVLLPRRLRFVGYHGLFRPPLHALFLEACGALPIVRREDDARGAERNRETFAAVHRAFERGEAVVMFPEGASREDRTVEAFRTGSARMALGYEVLRRRSPPLRVVPVGLTFSRRGAFHSDVTVAVGEAIALEPFLARAARDFPGAVRDLTAALRAGLTARVASVGPRGLVSTLHAVEDLALESLAAEPGAPARFELQRWIAAGLERERARHPERFARFERRLAAHVAALAAAGLDGRTLAEPETRSRRRARARLVTLGALGALPALAGSLLHAPGWAISLLAGALFGRDPTRLSFARIMAGLAAFSAGYAGLAAWLRLRAGVGPVGIALALAGCAGLGLFALGYLDWLSRERRRLRLAVLAATRPRWVAAARSRRRRLLCVVRAAARAEAGARRQA